MLLKSYLDKSGIENFLPMRYQSIAIKGKRKLVLSPIIHNLVFVYSDRKVLDVLKKELEVTIPMRYIMDKEKKTPIIIPEIQMRNFIAVAGTNDEQLLWIDSSNSLYKKGDSVRIVGGKFCGVEGILLKKRGKNRVVVSVNGFFSVATAELSSSMIEKIK